MQIIETEFVPEFTQVPVRQRKWAHRVMYQRYREFDFEDRRVMVSADGKLYMHPNTAKIVREQTNANLQA